jgi:hypothetical protein
MEGVAPHGSQKKEVIHEKREKKKNQTHLNDSHKHFRAITGTGLTSSPLYFIVEGQGV